MEPELVDEAVERAAFERESRTQEEARCIYTSKYTAILNSALSASYWPNRGDYALGRSSDKLGVTEFGEKGRAPRHLIRLSPGGVCNWSL